MFQPYQVISGLMLLAELIYPIFEGANVWLFSEVKPFCDCPLHCHFATSLRM